MKKVRSTALLTLLVFIFNIISPIVPTIALAESINTGDKLVLNDEEAKNDLKPEIIKLKKEGKELNIQWLPIGNKGSYEVKIGNNIYKTNSNKFVYPAYSNLDGTTVAIREEVEGGFSKWSNEECIKIEGTQKIQKKELNFIQRAFTTANLENQEDIQYKPSVFATFNGVKKWEDESYGPKDSPIEKFKISKIKSPSGVTLKYQAYVFDKDSNSGAWQDTKKEGEEAGEAGKTITSIKIWLEGTNYDIRYNVISDNRESNPLISNYVQSGAEAVNPAINKKPITSMNFEIIEGLPKIDIQTYGNYNGQMKWSNLDQDKDGFFGADRTGVSKIKMTTSRKPQGLSIKYQVYIKENNDWQEWKEEGQEAGEEGKTITNFRTKIDGVNGYLIRYNFKAIMGDDKEYISKYGSNGDKIPNCEPNIKALMGIYAEICKGEPEIKIQTFGEFNGGVKRWSDYHMDEYYGPLDKPINKFVINLANKPKGLLIKYQVYLKEKNCWQDWKKEGECAGLDNDVITSIRVCFDGDSLGNNVKYKIYSSTKDQDMYRSEYGYNGVEPPGSQVNRKPIAGIYIEQYSLTPISELNINNNEIVIDQNYEIPQGTEIKIPSGKKIKFDYSKTKNPGFLINGRLSLDGTSTNPISISDDRGYGTFDIQETGKLNISYSNSISKPNYDSLAFIKNKGEVTLKNSNFTSTSRNNDFIYTNSAKSLVIDNCIIKNWTSATNVDGTGNVRISNSRIEENRIGIMICDGAGYNPSNKIEIINNLYIGGNEVGILVNRSGQEPLHKQLVISSNTLDGNTNSGVMLSCDKLSNIIISKNTVKNTNKNRQDTFLTDGSFTKGGPIVIKLNSINDDSEGTRRLISDINSKDNNVSNTIDEGNNVDGIVLQGVINKSIKICDGKYKYIFDGITVVEKGTSLFIDQGSKVVLFGILDIRGELVTNGIDNNPVIISSIADGNYPTSHITLPNDCETGFSIYIRKDASYKATNTRYYRGGRTLNINNEKLELSTIESYGELNLSNCYVDNGENKKYSGIKSITGNLSLTGSTIKNAQNGIEMKNGGSLIKSTITNNHVGIYNSGATVTISKCNITNNTIGIDSYDSTNIYDSNIEDNSSINIDAYGEDRSIAFNILNCNIKSSGCGIGITGQPSVTINYNNIVGNQFGVECSKGNAIDAKYNYWGHIYGPSTYGIYMDEYGYTHEDTWSKYGDKISKEVAFEPFSSEEIKGLSLGIDEDKITQESYNLLKDYAYNLKKALYKEGVNPGSGNYSKKYTDLIVKCPGEDIELSRTYSSKNDKSGILGYGWNFYYEAYINDIKNDHPNVNTDGKIVALPGGEICSFQKDGNEKFIALDSRNTLEQVYNNYIVKKNDGRAYTFNLSGMLLEISSKEGNKIYFEYESNKISRIYDDCGREYIFNYSNNLLDKIQEKISDKNERIIKFNYANSQLNSVTDVEGNAQDIFGYDSSRRLSVISRDKDIIEKITYINDGDNKGKIASLLDENENTYVYTYDNVNRKLTIRDSLNNFTEMIYDNNLFLTNTVDRDGLTTLTDYSVDKDNNNILGEEKSIKDKFGYVTTYIRDNRGNIITEILPDLSRKQYVYDKFNNVVKEIDEVGNKTFYVYNESGILLFKKIRPLNGTDEYEENSDKEKFAITTYEYYEPTTLMKTKGLVKKIVNAGGGQVEYTYDVYGNVITEKDELGNTSIKTYDQYQNKINEKDHKGNTTSYTYDKKGNNLTTKSPNGETTTKVYDKYNRITGEISPNLYGKQILSKQYAFYKSGKLQSEVDSLGNRLEYTYDKYGNKLTEKNSLGAIHVYTYDSLNRPIRIEYKEEANGTNSILEESTYRIENSPGENIKVVQDKKVYSSKSSFSQVTNKYDHKANIVEHINGDGSKIKNVYNGKGQLICKTNENKSSSYYYYDINGNIIKSYEPSTKVGDSIKYKLTKNSYNKDGYKTQEMIGLSLVDDNADDTKYYTKNYEVDLKGNILSEKDSEGRRKDYFYDADYNKIREYEYKNETQYIAKDYTYNNNNKLIKESQSAIKGDISGNNATDLSTIKLDKSYEYDKNGNLSKILFPDGTIVSKSYDDLNRVIENIKTIKNSQDVNNVFSEKYTYIGNQNKVKTHKDANGNIVENIYSKDEKLVEERYSDGSIFKYEYDLASRETSKSVLDKHSQSYKKVIKEYDSNDKVTLETIKDNNGTILQIKGYKYDSSGNLIKDIQGEEFNKASGNTIIEKINNAKGIEYIYNLNNTLATVLNPDSKEKNKKFTYSFEYDVFGRKIKESDSNNNYFLYTLDSMGNMLKKEYVKKVEDKVSNPVILQTNLYDGLGNLISSIDGNGNKKEYTINSLGKVQSEIFPNDSSILKETYFYQYDLLGNIALKSQSNGSIEKMKWNVENKLLYKCRQGNNESIEEFIDYDGNGQEVSYKDGNGNLYLYKYDVKGNPIETSLNGKIKSTKEFNALNSILYDKDRFCNAITNVYDEAGRLIEKKDAFNKTIEKMNYNLNGLKVKSTDALGNETLFKYDLNNRITEVTDSMGNTTTTIYDEMDRVVEKIDVKRNSTKYFYDELGRLTTVQNALGERTEFAYDLNNNKISFKDGNGNVTSYKYNCSNKIYKIISPNKGNLTGKVQEFTYNADGSIKNVKDRNGNVISYEYDMFGRKVKESSGTNISYYSYDKLGSLIKATDPCETTQYKYDEEGRTTEKIVDDKIKVNYSYDITEGITSGYYKEKLVDNKGGTITKTFDKMNKLIAVNDGVKDTKYNYYDNGAKKETIFYDNSKETYEYNRNLTLKELNHIDSSGKTINYFKYLYDSNKNLIQKEDSKDKENGNINRPGTGDGNTNYFSKVKSTKVEGESPYNGARGIVFPPGGGIITPSSEGISEYSYDNLNRLSLVKNSYNKTISYSYDKAGNRTLECIKDNNGTNPPTEEFSIKKPISLSEEKYQTFANANGGYGTEMTKNYQYDENNRLTKISYSGYSRTDASFNYDNNGNLTKIIEGSDVNRDLKYDGYNRLIEVKDKGNVVEKNNYNFQGLRVKKEANSKITKYFYDGDNILLETDNNNNKIARNIYGTKLITREVEDKKGYYRYNGHGDVTDIYGENGNAIASYKYGTFGEVIRTTGSMNNPFKYSGYMQDDETGYYYLQSRMYDPTDGRFIQEDTYLGDEKDPLSLNLYTYCHNNPMMYDDQNGHWVHIAVGALIGAAVNTVSHAIDDYLDDGKINSGWKSYVKEAAIGAATGALAAATGGASKWARFGIDLGTDLYDTYRSNKRITFGDVATTTVGNALFGKVYSPKIKNTTNIVRKGISSNQILSKGKLALSKIDIGSLGKIQMKTNITAVAKIRTTISDSVSSLSKGKLGHELKTEVKDLSIDKLENVSSLSKIKGVGNPKPITDPARLLEAPKEVADHHLIPAFRGKSKPYADFIKQRGINVDDFTITVSSGKGGQHMNFIHGKGKWNQKWMGFIDNNPNATAKDIYQFTGKMMDDYGLSGYPIHSYKK